MPTEPFPKGRMPHGRNVVYHSLLSRFFSGRANVPGVDAVGTLTAEVVRAALGIDYNLTIPTAVLAKCLPRCLSTKI